MTHDSLRTRLKEDAQRLRASGSHTYREVAMRIDAMLEESAVSARSVLNAADADVGVARLSDDGLSWICPRCEEAVHCKPDCSRAALLLALDRLADSVGGRAP